MKVINIHRRIIERPKTEIAELFKTLASKNDLMWPFENWPPMRLDQGLTVGSKGGHGPIKYTVEEYEANEFIQFKFTHPKGFNGFHRFEILALSDNSTELKHIIDMKATFAGTLQWVIAIRWLHDALVEDAFDKVENQFNLVKRENRWTIWVKLLRKLLE